MAIINHSQIAAIDTPEQLKRAFQRVQSVEVALEPDIPKTLKVFETFRVSHSVKMGDKWRLGTYDRLIAAPMSLLTLLLGKTAVGRSLPSARRPLRCSSAWRLLAPASSSLGCWPPVSCWRRSPSRPWG